MFTISKDTYFSYNGCRENDDEIASLNTTIDNDLQGSVCQIPYSWKPQIDFSSTPVRAAIGFASASVYTYMKVFPNAEVSQNYLHLLQQCL